MSTDSSTTTPAKPKLLDQLFIPGMSPAFEGFDGGIPLWLLARDLTVTVQKNWRARPGDEIEVVSLPDMRVLAHQTLLPGEEDRNTFSFAISANDLPDGEMILGYVVQFEGGPASDRSDPLKVLVKRTLPGGKDKDRPTPGHSELKFKLSDTEIKEIQALRGVTITIEPYPDMHWLDVIELQAGNYFAPRQRVSGVGKQTEITLNYEQITAIGNGSNRLVSFQVVDAVGNVSTPRSRSIPVLVDVASVDLPAPIFATQDFPGFIDLERLNGEPLHIQLFTYPWDGPSGHTYFVTYRGLPKLGGVVLHDEYITIIDAGRPHDFYVPYGKVSACVGGKVDISYRLLKTDLPTRYSKFASAQVTDAIIQLQPPFFVRYISHVVNPIPSSGAAVEIPWYAWRRPTDKIMLLLRYQIPGSNELILYPDEFTVGQVPEGVPIRRLIPYADLLRFNGYSPDLYYVYEPDKTLANTSTSDINESLRQVVQIGAKSAER